MEPFSPFYEIPRGAKVRVGRTEPEDRGRRHIVDTCKLPSGMDLTFDLPLGDSRFLDDFLIQDLLHLQSYISGNEERYYKKFGNIVGDGAYDALKVIEGIVYQRLQNGGLIKEIPYEEWARNRPTIKQVNLEDITKAPSETDSDDLYSSDLIEKERRSIQAWWEDVEDILHDIECTMGEPLAPPLRTAIRVALSSNEKIVGNAFRAGTAKPSAGGASPVQSIHARAPTKGKAPSRSLPQNDRRIDTPTDRNSLASKTTDQYQSRQVPKQSIKKPTKSGSEKSKTKDVAPKKVDVASGIFQSKRPHSGDHQGFYLDPFWPDQITGFDVSRDPRLPQGAVELEATEAKPRRYNQPSRFSSNQAHQKGNPTKKDKRSTACLCERREPSKQS